MKKFLSILLAVLVLGACTTATVDAKKRTTRKARTTKVAKRDLVRTYCKIVKPSELRAGPNMDCPVIMTLQKGHKVFVRQQIDDWFYIDIYPGTEVEGTQSGWTLRKNLRYFAPDDGVN